jgi:hypothetical protein
MMTMMTSANNNNPHTSILGHMLWSNEEIIAVLALQRTSPETRWNGNIGNYLKGGDGAGLTNRLLCTPSNCVSGAPSDAVYRIESQFGQLLGFDTPSVDAKTGETEDMCFIKVQVKHTDVSHAMEYVPLPMLDEHMMLSSNIVVRCRFQDIRAVKNIFHSTKYDNKTMQGFYNVFFLSSKVHCGRTYKLS